MSSESAAVAKVSLFRALRRQLDTRTPKFIKGFLWIAATEAFLVLVRLALNLVPDHVSAGPTSSITPVEPPALHQAVHGVQIFLGWAAWATGLVSLILIATWVILYILTVVVGGIEVIAYLIHRWNNRTKE